MFEDKKDKGLSEQKTDDFTKQTYTIRRTGLNDFVAWLSISLNDRGYSDTFIADRLIEIEENSKSGVNSYIQLTLSHPLINGLFREYIEINIKKIEEDRQQRIEELKLKVKQKEAEKQEEKQSQYLSDLLEGSSQSIYRFPQAHTAQQSFREHLHLAGLSQNKINLILRNEGDKKNDILTSFRKYLSKHFQEDQIDQFLSKITCSEDQKRGKRYINIRINDPKVDMLFKRYLTSKIPPPAPKGYQFLGSGTYNWAYTDGFQVIKLPKYPQNETDKPERCVRLWNLINDHIQPAARIVHTEHGKGWICPFIKGTQASDQEIADTLVDIFNKTGRIVVDAVSYNNFIRKPDGTIACVDIGMAVQMDQQEEKRMTAVGHKLSRINSNVSLRVWKQIEPDYQPFFTREVEKNPLAVNTVKALLFIQAKRPDIFDASCIKGNSLWINKFAAAYDADYQNRNSFKTLKEKYKGIQREFLGEHILNELNQRIQLIASKNDLKKLRIELRKDGTYEVLEKLQKRTTQPSDSVKMSLMERLNDLFDRKATSFDETNDKGKEATL